ncbi:MAG: alpha/beta hydrolase [Pseudomonadota bacterium]
MPKFKVRSGFQISYELDDFTDPWEKRPILVLQHGNGRSANFWYRWIPYLARFYRIIRPDMRGLGKSRGNWNLDQDFTLDRLLEDLIAVLDHAGADTVHFCGESMGGILGLATSARHPERVRTLTLVSTPVYIEEQMKERYALGKGSRIEAMQEMGIRSWVAATTRSTRIPADDEPELFAWYVDEFAKGDPQIQIAMSKLVSQANAHELLAQVNVPVLGLYPTKGQITSDTQESMLKDGLKHFELVHLPTGYHMVQLLYPEACTDALISFCSHHDRAATVAP